MAYFVAYQLCERKTGERLPISNVILKKSHPIEWANKGDMTQYLVYLLFFTEIDASLIDQPLINVED